MQSNLRVHYNHGVNANVQLEGVRVPARILPPHMRPYVPSHDGCVPVAFNVMHVGTFADLQETGKLHAMHSRNNGNGQGHHDVDKCKDLACYNCLAGMNELHMPPPVGGWLPRTPEFEAVARASSASEREAAGASDFQQTLLQRTLRLCVTL